MSNEIVFRTQLASIMEVLANAAVEEICKLVDDGYTVLHLQMSEYEKENAALKMRLHLMELNAVRGCAAQRTSPRENPLDHYSDGVLQSRERPRGTAEDGPTVAGNGVLGNCGDICLPSLRPTGEESSSTTFDLKQVETADAENDRSEAVLIKEESPDECSDPHTDLKIPVQGALDSGAGDEEGVPALGLGVSPAECSEELAEPDRTGNRTGVWEVSGLEAVLRLQAETTAIERLGDAGLEGGAGTPSGRGSETPGHTQTGTEVQDRSRPFRGADSERRPAQSELRTISGELKGACVRLSSSSDSSDLKTDVVVIDCVKEESVSVHSEWDTEPAVPARPNVQHGRHRDDRKTEEARPEHVNPSSLPRVWQTSNFDAGGLNGTVACERQFGASTDFTAGSNNSAAREKRFICRYCGKGFTRHNALEIHQRVHTGEKPFRCTQCGKRFSDSSNHRRHQSVHSRERPFSCTQCERSFSHHYQLKVHQRVHTGDRPFSCAHCGKRFGERGFLTMHQQRDHAPLYGSMT